MRTRKATDAERVEAGKRLRERREAAKVGVTLMAHLLDCDPKTIDNYEKGHTKAGGAVEFAYDNIDRLLASRLGKRTLTWDGLTSSQDPLPFDQDDVIDLREHILNQTAQNDSQDLYANAS